MEAFDLMAGLIQLPVYESELYVHPVVVASPAPCSHKEW